MTVWKVTLGYGQLHDITLWNKMLHDGHHDSDEYNLALAVYFYALHSRASDLCHIESLHISRHAEQSPF